MTGPLTIGHNVIGGVGTRSGHVVADRFPSASIGGSLVGGPGGFSGELRSTLDDIGPVRIGHNVVGDGGADSGRIESAGKLISVRIGGSLMGGPNGDSGSLVSGGDMGAVTIGSNLVGAGGGDSGNLQAGGKLASVTIGGSIFGAGGGDSGEITSIGDMGPVRIGHDFSGGGGGTSGNIFTDGKLASLTIGGSLVGGPAGSSGRIRSEMDMGAVKIGHDMIGGSGSGAGDLLGGGKLAAINIGGSLIGGSADEAGEIHFTGDIGAVKIGRDLVGGSITGGALNETGYIDSVTGRIGSVTLGGSIISGIDDSTTGGLTMNASIRAGDDIGALTVKGSLIGNVTPNGASLVIISAHGQAVPVGDKNLAIGKITIGGRVERANIFGGYSVDLVPADGVQIGTVKVGRDWIASNLVAGVTNLGADDNPGGTGANADNVNFGDTHDTFIGLGSITNRIAAIVIGGVVAGTAASGDHFGFSSVSIGSFKSLGFTAPLTAGASDDPIEISPITHDVTIREI
jgi:autotransporter family porin